MNRDQKAAVIQEVADQMTASEAIFALDYRGLSVKQAADLRGRLQDVEAELRVVKNTLSERAAEQAGKQQLTSLLEGPTAFAFVRGDAAVAAKALAAFRRETQLLEFKGGTLDGDALSADQVESIARLPARDVLQSQFVGVLASPLTGLVRGLGSLIGGLAVALGQIQERGLVGGAAVPAGEVPPEPGPAPEVPGEPGPDVPPAPDVPPELPTAATTDVAAE